MNLPSYSKTKRAGSSRKLPKGAYVVEIRGARLEPNKNGGGSHISIAFDIVEGDYAGIYANLYRTNAKENKKWPLDGMYYLTVPSDGCGVYVWKNWNSFFSDLEDSNGGFVFKGEILSLAGKRIGGKFRIEQTEYNGVIYDHTRLAWTCVADDVRIGNTGKMPKDKLIERITSGYEADKRNVNPFTGRPDGDDFDSVQEETEEEIIF